MVIPEATRSRLLKAPVFAGVAPEAVERLLTVCQQHQYRDEDMIFARGDRADRVFVIISGMVRITTLGESGKRIVAEIFREPDLFGEIAAIDAEPRTADAIAYGGVDLVTIPLSAFQAMLDSSARFAQNLLRLVIGRLRHTYSLLEDASLLNLELRLAKQVLYLRRLGATGDKPIRVHARMHQEDLADLLGATSRSIITILNKWRTEGLATFDGRSAQITIQDPEKFAALVQGSKAD
jgi:CRP-like cAMP-binding protein